MPVIVIERLVIRALAIFTSLFFFYTAYFGTLDPHVQRAVPLMLCVMLTFLFKRARSDPHEDAPEGDPQHPGRDAAVPWYDWLLALGAVPTLGYVAFFSDYLAERWPLTTQYAPNASQIVVAVLGSFLLLEATRRIMGKALVIIIALALAYCYWGEYVPWRAITHRAFGFTEIVDYMYLTLEGIWGNALGIAASYIALFSIYGAIAQKAGIFTVFYDIAIAVAGNHRGGGAKAATVASGMFGTVSGSTVANVYTMGQFTIPMMKKLGYRATLAGAVEALAGNGGQIMPPVLGAAAFIVAANIGMPYAQVAAASAIPALIYYAMLWWDIHLVAHRDGLKGLPREQIPRLLPVLLRRGYLLLPLLLLIVLLFHGTSPMRAGLYAIFLMVAISWFSKENRLGPRRLLEALEDGGKNAVMIIIVCAAIGFIVGTFTFTGLGLNISSAIVGLAGSNYYLVLVFAFVACIVLGTGMNTVADFILVAVIAVPAMKALHIDPLPANMFVFYGSLLSHITPPVCLGIIAAATLAGSNVWETALEGLKLGVIAYLLPFIVVFSPELLLQGTWPDILLAIAVNVFGSAFVIAGIQGWLFSRLPIWGRLVAIGAGIASLLPVIEARIGGVVLCVILGIVVWMRHQLAPIPETGRVGDTIP